MTDTQTALMEKMKLAAVSARKVFDNTFKTVYKRTLQYAALHYTTVRYTTLNYSTPQHITVYHPQKHHSIPQKHHSTSQHTTETQHLNTAQHTTENLATGTPQYSATHYAYYHTLRFIYSNFNTDGHFKLKKLNADPKQFIFFVRI